MYDRDGERIDPRDVLDDQELAEYYRSLRDRPRGRTPRRPAPERYDELGYNMRTGQWAPDKDGAA